MPSLCVFCASSDDIKPRYLTLAGDVGGAIAGRGWTLVSGGGSVGCMGELARSARAAGALTVGVIPEALLAWEVADRDADELVVTRDMRERKGEMDRRSDAFLALPGGIGTLEELLEIWVARSLRMHDKPVVVLDPWGDFAPLKAMIEDMVAAGFVRDTAAAQVVWTATVQEALRAVERGWAHTGAPAAAEPTPAEFLEADP